MPARRLSISKAREVLRFEIELGVENRQIARSCLIPLSLVANYLSREKAAGLRWPLPEELERILPGGLSDRGQPLKSEYDNQRFS